MTHIAIQEQQGGKAVTWLERNEAGQELGTIDSGIEAFHRPGPVKVRIELLKK